MPANYLPDAPVRSRLGTGYVFQGVVRSSQGCGPFPGASVEIWHANPDGSYDAEHRALVAVFFPEPSSTSGEMDLVLEPS